MELDPVTQEFIAETDPYVEGMRAAIDATDAFRESVDAALRDVLALDAALDRLNDKTIHVNVETNGIPENVAANVGNVGPVDTAGVNAEEDALRNLGDVADTTGEDLRNVGDAADEMGTGFQRASGNSDSLEEGFARLDETLRDQNAAIGEADAKWAHTAETLGEIGLSYRGMTDEGILPANDAMDAAEVHARNMAEAYQDLIASGLAPADAAWAAQYTRIGATSEALRDSTSAFAAVDDAAVTDAEHLRAVGDAAEAATVPFTALGFAAKDATVPFERVRVDTDAMDTALRDVGAAAPTAAAGLTAAGTAAEDSGNSARRAYGWWGLLTKEVTLWGGVLGDAHLIGMVQLWHIALDGLFESAVALGEGLAALSVGIAAMTPAAEDIYTHLQSVDTVSKALRVSIPPLTGNFQALARSMAPQTVEAFGGALNLLNSEGSTTAKVAEQVVTGLDDWIAKLDIWKESQASTGALLQNGVGFLHQFEQMLDNVGIAIDNLMKADPGTAHYLMDLVVGFTKVLDVITEIPAPILQAALALHSFMLWGGLLFTGLTKLLTPIRAVAAGLGGLGAASSAVKNLGEDASGTERLAATLHDIGAGLAGIGPGVLQFAPARASR